MIAFPPIGCFATNNVSLLCTAGRVPRAKALSLSFFATAHGVPRGWFSGCSKYFHRKTIILEPEEHLSVLHFGTPLWERSNRGVVMSAPRKRCANSSISCTPPRWLPGGLHSGHKYTIIHCTPNIYIYIYILHKYTHIYIYIYIYIVLFVLFCLFCLGGLGLG